MAFTSRPRSSTPATSPSAKRNCRLRAAFPRTEEPTMNQPNQPAHVQDKTQKPQGLLPKNVQSWLLIGLAFLMVAIMWLTGGKKAPTPTKTASSAPPALAPLEVNETKISELQNRIEQLQRDQMVAQNALTQQTRLLGGVPQDSQQVQQQSASGYPPDQRAEDPIQAERKRRAYVSLFASNVALTYRKTPSTPAVAPAPESEASPPNPSLVPVGPDSPQVAQLLKQMEANPPSTEPTRKDSPEPTHDRKEEARNPAAVSASSANAAAGKTYVLFE